MPELIWIVAAVLGLTLIQVVLYRYLQARSGALANVRGSEGSQQSYQSEQGSGPELSDGWICQACGAPNGSDFTFCRNCVTKVGS